MIDEETKEFLTCKMDAMFKTIVMDEKNPELLEAILSCVLEGHPHIISWPVTHLKNTLAHEKFKTRDLVVELDGTYINLEVETAHGPEVRSKLFTYLASMWKQNILQNEKYDTKTLFLQIVLQYGLSKNNKVMREYKMQSIDESTRKVTVWVENFKIIEVNMERLKQMWYDKSSEDIEKYKYLMMLDMNKSDLISLQKINGSDKIVKEYSDKVCELNRNVNFINTIGKEKEKEYMFNTRLELVREESLEQGKKEKNLENAKALLQNGVSKEIVIKSLNLTKEEIKSLDI